MAADREETARRLAEQAAANNGDESDETGYAVRTDATREVSGTASSRGEAVETASTGATAQGVTESYDPFQQPFGAPGTGPGQMQETVDVATAAPDGTAIGERGTFTSPTGDAVGGSTLSDDVQSRGSEFGGDSFGRGLDFDLLTPGANDTGPGGRETTGDPDVDRAIMENDGSMMSAPRELKKMDPNFVPRQQKTDDGDVPKQLRDKDYDKPTKPAPAEEKSLLDSFTTGVKDFLGFGDDKDDKGYESADGDGGANSEANLERVTVMQGSRGQPSNNPDDTSGTGTSTENFIPPPDLVKNPGAEEAVADTSLTASAGLGSDPVTNPDPTGGDGIITGGSYGGGSGGGSTGGGGGEITPTGMTASDASAASVGAADPDDDGEDPGVQSMGGGELGGKGDINGVQIDMATGQVLGSAAPAMGGELSTATAIGAPGDAASALGGLDADAAPTGGFAPPPDMSGAMAPSDDPMAPSPEDG